MKNVCIVGGSGCKTSLRSLKDIKNLKISSVISMFDSGGSTGYLRREFGIYALGDLRDNMLTAANNKPLKELMEQRLEINGEKHSLGNLVLLSAIKKYGEEYISVLHSLLKINNRIRMVPVIDNINYNGNLVIKTESGVLIGEHNLDTRTGLKVVDIQLDIPIEIGKEAKKSIESADFIIFGPGDLYSSILPNVLVNGFKEAVNESKAKKILVCNIMTKENETVGFKTSDFLNAFKRYGIRLDKIIVNNKSAKTKNFVSKYGKMVDFIENDLPKKDIIEANLINEDITYEHDTAKLKKVMLKVFRLTYKPK